MEFGTNMIKYQSKHIIFIAEIADIGKESYQLKVINDSRNSNTTIGSLYKQYIPTIDRYYELDKKYLWDKEISEIINES